MKALSTSVKEITGKNLNEAATWLFLGDFWSDLSLQVFDVNKPVAERVQRFLQIAQEKGRRSELFKDLPANSVYCVFCNQEDGERRECTCPCQGRDAGGQVQASSEDEPELNGLCSRYRNCDYRMKRYTFRPLQRECEEPSESVNE